MRLRYATALHPWGARGRQPRIVADDNIASLGKEKLVGPSRRLSNFRGRAGVRKAAFEHLIIGVMAMLHQQQAITSQVSVPR
jgi:hypothetical protein